jgi:hypothetical protein
VEATPLLVPLTLRRHEAAVTAAAVHGTDVNDGAAADAHDGAAVASVPILVWRRRQRRRCA